MDHPNNSGMRPPFASTPNNSRMQRPRFAYSGPPNYPRPGSSASKPNPDFSVSDIMRSRYMPQNQQLNDSMANNYGDSFLDMSMPNYDNSFQSEYSSGSFQSQDSIYYSCNESFANSPGPSFPQRGMRPPHPNTEYMEPIRPALPPASSFSQPPRFKARSSMVDQNKRKPFYKKGAQTKPKDPVAKHVWRCALCDIVFTSSIPYDMHKNGSKHAKKLKAQEVRQAVETEVAKTKEIEAVGSTFRCDLCGIIANSPNQFQMHLDGVKHKAKVLAKQKEEDEAKNPKKLKTEDEKPEASTAEEKTDEEKGLQPNGTKDKEKQKGPSAIAIPVGLSEKTSFSCATCELFLNSDVQLQQHLLGKYHKAKVEGTTLPFHQKKKHTIRKALDAKGAIPNTTEEGKTAESIEKSENNSAETTKTIESEAEKPEIVKQLDSEASKATEPEASKNVEPETSQVS